MHIDEPRRNGTQYPTYQMGYGGPASRWMPAKSYWATTEPQVRRGGTLLSVAVELLASEQEWSWIHPG